tara:strand:+ start:46 stop:390 length:345 start_codon:yes stop_codon:yes gene_type:complete
MNETSWAWIFFLSAIIATYIWRFTAVMISHRIKANNPIFEWVTCLSYGIIGALVANSLFFPTGILLFVPLWQRISAITLSFLGFYLLGKKLLLGIIFGEAGLIMLLWFSGINNF